MGTFLLVAGVALIAIGAIKAKNAYDAWVTAADFTQLTLGRGNRPVVTLPDGTIINPSYAKFGGL